MGTATMLRRLQALVSRWRGSKVAIEPKSTTRATTTRIGGLCTGEALVGEGNEIAHIDLIMGPRGSAAEKAFANSLTNNKDGFTSLLAVIAPNLMVKPATVMFNKVTIKDANQALQMFGPAQHAVAKAVADSVAEGVIPRDQANDLFICVGVFIHWDAADNKKIQDYNYRATKEAIARAIAGDPKPSEVIAKRNVVKHPFAA
jgi:5,6,7,8-tetrahydromethanopterin hydro-lyase